MNGVKVRKGKLPLKKKLLRLTAIFLAVAIVAAGGIYIFFFRGATDSDYILTAYPVTKGDISTVITGSGTVQPIQQYDIVSLVQGDILEDNVTVGNTVEAGDLLYRIDTTDADNNIRKSEIALEKQKLSYQETVDSSSDLVVTAPVSGVITTLYVKNGENVNSNSTVADIVSSETLKLKIPFNANDAKNISINSKAQIYMDSTNEELSGKVTGVSSGTYVTSSGAVVSDVEITFTNPGALDTGATATAIIGDYACNEPGTVSYAVEQSIVAKASGEVTGLSYKEGDKIGAGSTLFVIDSSDTSAKSSELSIQEAELDLQDMKNQLDNYNIASPISGTIVSKSQKAGDTLDSNKTTLAVVADMTQLSFTMNVDELDIKSVSVGQTVNVTADALPNEEFIGTVTTIGIIGTSTSGVTTYPVKVVISEYEGLLPGMNVNADIVSEEVLDVLRIPVAAVSRGNVVLVSESYAESIGAETLNTSNGNMQDRKSSAEGGSASADSSSAASSRSMPSGGSAAGGGSMPSGGSAAGGGSMPSGGSAASGSGSTQGMAAASIAGKIVEMQNTPDGYVWLTVETGMSDTDYIEITAGLTEGAEVYIMTVPSTGTEETTTTTTGFGMVGGISGGGEMPTGGGQMPTGGGFSGNQGAGNAGGGL